MQRHRIHGDVVKGERAGVLALCKIHREIGIAQQSIRISAILRKHGNSNARSDNKRVERKLHRLAQPANQPLGNRARVVWPPQVR
jgi:hypothetical protein